ncbi:MAG: Sensor protein [Verrucomicrobiales bacterium]|nr:Sensor protein [Verrucomicrobiales bacterium]
MMDDDDLVNSTSKDVALIQAITAVPAILDVICRTTGMGFAAVARVTESRWVACSVLDHIQFGLPAGGELELETTICHEIRQSQAPVVIDHVARDEVYCGHHTPLKYGFQSYISMPIFLKDGQFFGTLCSIDPNPARLNTPETLSMFKLFAELIAFHIDGAKTLARSESQLQEVREISQLREQFIGVLGHDLRNPLNAISMGTMLLSESPLEPEDKEVVRMMDRSISRMSELIDDVVDFTRGRLGGGIPIGEKLPEPLEPMLWGVIGEMSAVRPDRKIETTFALSGEVSFDRKRLSQLFANLLSNAIFHGKPGTPVQVRATGGGVEELKLSVSNAADPIPPEVLARLFKPFSRGEPSGHQEGLGLGLYIASEIARSHGGSLSVISNEQETIFTFVMPASPL